MLGGVGPTELIVIVLIALLVFGAGRIADIGKGLGQGIKNFKQGLREAADDDAQAQAENAEKATKKEEAAAKEA